MTIAITVDRRWGGFYVGGGRPAWRICLGFVAFDFFSESLELIHRSLLGLFENSREG